MELALESGTLGFEVDGIELSGGAPSVSILTGAEEELIELLPEGRPVESSGWRRTWAGSARQRSWRWTDQRGYAFVWTVNTLENQPGFTLQVLFYNGSNEPVRLREIALCRTPIDALNCPGDPSAWWLSTLGLTSRAGHLGEVLPSANDVDRNIWEGFGLPIPYDLPSDERSNDGRWRTFTDFLTLYTDKGKHGLAMGAVGPAEADVRFDCRVNEGRMQLNIVSEMTDVRVDPGGTRQSEEVLILAGYYDTAVTTLLHWIAATHGHRTHRGPIFGWCSWYDLAGSITAEHVKSVAGAVADLRDSLPMQVIQVDDGFQRQVGDWVCNEKFPDGWGPVVEKIRSAGAIPGIWLAPLAVHDSLGLLETHPAWFQRDAQSKLAGEVNNWGPTGHWLDPTHPDAAQFIREIVRQARRAGFEYFKIDFNGVGGRMHNPYKTRLQAYRDLYRLYREEVGESAYLLACSGFVRGVIGFADAARIGPDSCDKWDAPHPCCIRECIRTAGLNTLANGLLFANDPDVTYAKPRGTLTGPEWRTWHSFVGLLGGSAMISEPMHQPAYMEAARMVEIMNPPSPERGHSFYAGTDREHRKFGFMVCRPWGHFAAILLYNPEDVPGDVVLDTAGLESLGERFHVWSFWDETYQGVGDADFVARNLPPHGPALLRLTALSDKDDLPVLVGSNLHLSMGAAEIADVAVTSDRLTMALNDAGARSGKLYVFSKHPLILGTVSGCAAASVAPGPEYIWTVSISGRRRGEQHVIGLSIGGADTSSASC
ncbi:MAG: alpha-galactosidase [Candidatus Latescibacterota bacterium]